jgi:hypothetical protein
MSDALNVTSAQARAIVLQAATENGWISQADRDNSPAGTLQALQNVRKRLGDALEMYITVKNDSQVFAFTKIE